MRLRFLLPDQVLFDGPVAQVTAETVAGSRGLLPLHIDFAAPLKQGIMVAKLPDGSERFFAHNRGLLVKKGAQVTVAAPRAVSSNRLEALRQKVAEERALEDEHARAALKALAQLETRLVREFMELVR